MNKIVRFTGITYPRGEPCFPGVDFGRHSFAEVEPYAQDDDTAICEIVRVLCAPEYLDIDGGGWVLRPDEVEDVTQDEIDAAIAYCTLVDMYVGKVDA